ncbi:thermostable hemolysin, partial [Acidiphilium sp.]|uniref:thermostable hemolysin n=1 Tax=Acidiphilium sp. TaxID=527 RepID=UPI003D0244C8
TTAGLRKLLDYHHIPFIALTEACSARLPEGERERWGSYYDNSPLTGIIPLQECGHLFSNHCGRFVFANLLGAGAGSSTSPSPVPQEAVA